MGVRKQTNKPNRVLVFFFCVWVLRDLLKRFHGKRKCAWWRAVRISVSVRYTVLKIRYLIMKQHFPCCWCGVSFMGQVGSAYQMWTGMLRPARAFLGISYRQTHTCAQKCEALSATVKTTVNNLNVYMQGTDWLWHIHIIGYFVASSKAEAVHAHMHTAKAELVV